MTEDFTVSLHAKERYAERIMDRETKIDKAVFISQHEDKIRNDIKKMMEYGTLVYSGKSVKTPGSLVAIYVKDLWVVITDPKKNNVITLYRIDLGIDDEFNKEYVDRVMQRIVEERAAYESAVVEQAETVAQYDELIQENENLIRDYKTKLKDLEALNESYADIKKNLMKTVNIKEERYRDAVMMLTGKKVF